MSTPLPVAADADERPASLTDTWTGRRRLLTALTCGIPDRVPINTYEMPGRNEADWYSQQPSYAALMKYIRDNTDAITNWNARINGDETPGTEGLFESAHRMPIETQEERHGTRTRVTQIAHMPKGDLRQVYEHDPSVYTTWNIEHWCKSMADVDIALSGPYEPYTYSATDLTARQEELGEHGLIMSSLSDPAFMAAHLMGFQDYTMWLYEDTEHFARCVDILAERVLQNLSNQLDAAVVDLYRICGPEYMTPPYARPAMFERFMVPHVRAMTERIHERGGYVRLHCHGRIASVLDMFFETGCDGTDPCEPPPDGDLELYVAKRRCLENKVSVWGNMELKVLEQGAPQQVRDTVRDMMDQAKEGGGFVLLPTAAPINVPLSPQTEANYMTMIDTALELGVY
ncbi:MAG: hypothetical protein HQ523_02140 [Lentisphaerae bacterium]|nr:hypothetical protein [Lentisphaerota bacterium]